MSIHNLINNIGTLTMKTSNFNIVIDNGLRSQATEILAGYGLSPSQAVNLFFDQIVATRSLPWQTQTEAIIPNDFTAQAIRQGRLDYKAGLLDRFEPEDALEAIQELSRG